MLESTILDYECGTVVIGLTLIDWIPLA